MLGGTGLALAWGFMEGRRAEVIYVDVAGIGLLSRTILQAKRPGCTRRIWAFTIAIVIRSPDLRLTVIYIYLNLM